MNKLPEGLPPMPEGAVPLGWGGEFALPKSQKFDGYMWEHGDEIWFVSNGINGSSQRIFYAAPADSEIARLNGLSESETSPYTEATRAIADALRCLEIETGQIVRGVEIEDIDASTYGDDLIIRRVHINLERLPGTKWSDCDE